jgi:hypothetical protein
LYKQASQPIPTADKTHRMRTYRVLDLAQYDSVGKLPEPESTHDFF